MKRMLSGDWKQPVIQFDSEESWVDADDDDLDADDVASMPL